MRNDVVSEEPIVSYTVIGGLVTIVVGGLAVWGLPLTQEQTEWSLTSVPIVVMFVIALLARRKTVPYARVTAYETKASGTVVAGQAPLDDMESSENDPIDAGDDFHDVPAGTPVVVLPADEYDRLLEAAYPEPESENVDENGNVSQESNPENNMLS